MIDRQEKIEKARSLFLSGYNCAQAVAAAFAEEAGMTEEQMLRLSGGFGGGMGGLRLVCGAVSGMFMVESLMHGYSDSGDMEGKKSLYAAEQRMAARFTEKYDTLNCRELLIKSGVEVKSTPSERTPEYYKQRPCVRYVEECAGILADELNQQ